MPVLVRVCRECDKSVVGRYLSLGLCSTCYARMKYRSDPNTRQRVIFNTKKWQNENQDIIKQWKDNNIERVRECERIRYMLNPQKHLSQDRSQRLSMRHRAIHIVGHGIIKCVSCDCDREELLQINHKNGGGGKERRQGSTSDHTIFGRIVSGRRGIDDLELRCYACNALHYMEMKYGKLPMNIRWEGDE